MTQPGQSWPFKPSVSAQGDYWDLDMINLAMKEKEEKKKALLRKKPIRVQATVNKTPIKTLEGDLFSKNGIKRLEEDFWGKNKKKSKPLNKSEKILKRIL